MSRDLFGLKDEPFGAYPDNKYFFSSILHDKAITLLEYGLNSRKGFMLLTGLKGTGKTMTCNVLKDSVSDCNVSIVNYEPVSSDELMKRICLGFGQSFPETDRQELFGRIMEYFVDEYKEGRNNLIIVDNAEDISEENLKMLSSFMEIEIEKCKLVQVILSGCPELHDRLKHLDTELGPKFTFTVELAPLSLKDTTDYVEHRIKTAIEDADEHIFKSKSYAEIYSFSKGIPSEINRIAHKAMSIAKERNKNRITSRHIKLAAARLYGVKVSRRASKKPYAAALILILIAVGVFNFKDVLIAEYFNLRSVDQTAVIEKEPEPSAESSAIKEEPAAPAEPPVVTEEEAAEAEKPAVTEEVVSPSQPETPVIEDKPTVEDGAEPLKAASETEDTEPVNDADKEPVQTEPAAGEPEQKIIHGCITAKSGLKVRSGASVKTDLIGTAPNMAYIKLLELSEDGKWWKAMYEGSYGYLYAKYIRVVDTPEDCSQ